MTDPLPPQAMEPELVSNAEPEPAQKPKPKRPPRLNRPKPDRPFVTVARNYRAARILLGWTQRDLAAKTGMLQAQISHFELGGRLGDKNMARIMDVFKSHGIAFFYSRGLLQSVSYADVNGGVNVIRNIRATKPAPPRGKKKPKPRAPYERTKQPLGPAAEITRADLSKSRSDDGTCV